MSGKKRSLIFEVPISKITFASQLRQTTDKGRSRLAATVVRYLDSLACVLENALLHQQHLTNNPGLHPGQIGFLRTRIEIFPYY